MRVMHIISQATRDGPGSVLYNIVKGLNKDGHTQMLISLHGKEDLVPEVEEYVKYFKNLHHNKPIEDYTKFYDMVKMVFEFKPNIIHAHLIRSTLLMKTLGYFIKTPIIFTYHNMEKHMLSHDIKSISIRMIEKRLDKKRYFYTGVSKEVAEFLENVYKFDGRRTKYIRNFSDIGTIVNEKYEPPIGFFFLGRLHKQKNISNIILAVEKIQKFMRNHLLDLEIFGQGNLELELKNLVKTLNIEDIVKFPGFHLDFWEKEYSSRRILVMSSEYEGMPMALLEAVGNRIPVITNIVGDVGELLNKENSYIHTGDDPEELGILMKLAIKEGKEAYNKSEKAIEVLLSKFSKTDIISQYIDLYEEANES